ncbi:MULTISPECIES: hypothetical protein [Bacillus]|nr:MULTISPECIES: hypothetical protein [Bacillus]MDU0069894.1 hypothetical protein [Bacillus sp. IG6]MED8020954.1 hypothetical protein [Bacillus glycinifermentans]WKB79255.1 hypothetical protein QYM22_10560 [Bacillus glycinifermentans]
MKHKVLIEELKWMIENKISQTSITDGTRYYLLSRDQLEEIIEALKRN